MRTLMYKVRDNMGNEFTTTSYKEATSKENHLICSFVIPTETPEDEKVISARKTRVREKIAKKFGIKY